MGWKAEGLSPRHAAVVSEETHDGSYGNPADAAKGTGIPPRRQRRRAAESETLPDATPPPAITRAASLVHDTRCSAVGDLSGWRHTVGLVARVPKCRRRLHPHLRHASRPGDSRLTQSGARIFCNKLEAELIAIDGLYRTAEDMDPQYRSRPVQAWLEGETMTMAALS